MHILALAALSFVGSAYGWGAVGHETVGFVAMPFLSTKALAFVKSTLAGSTFNATLGGDAATWADDVRSQAAFAFSAPFHFVDAEDNPPTSCSVSETRDCGNGLCILTAIANYTSRVVNTSLASTQRQQALLFLDHFIGDIGQPLHVEAFEVGGNDVDVRCSGSSTNLHSVWDSGIINKYIDANFSGSSQTWATSLVNRIKTGDFKSLASGWISCSSTTTPVAKRSLSMEEDVSEHLASRAITPLACPLVWAQESNKLDCSFVFSYPNFSDLCTTSYFTNAVPIIETQIAKQGFRLAAWLNVLFDGATNLP